MKSLLDPVSKSRLYEEIVTQFEEKIISGELKVGEKLPSERVLALTLNVNRATVREALKKLEMMGLIEIRHGDGVYVKDYHDSANLELLKVLINLNKKINVDVLNDLLEVRRVSVPQIAYLAAKNITDEQLQQLKNLIDDESLKIQEKDRKIHILIAHASDNLACMIIFNFLNEIVEKFEFLYFSKETNCDFSRQFHAKIYNALALHDKKLAQQIMKETMIYAEQEIAGYLSYFSE